MARRKHCHEAAAIGIVLLMLGIAWMSYLFLLTLRAPNPTCG